MSRKNKWLKHDNKASQGKSLSRLWHSKHYASICFFWRIMEMISRYEEENDRGRMIITFGIIAGETGWKKDKILTELKRLSEDLLEISIRLSEDCSEIVVRLSKDYDLESNYNLDTILEIYSPNWLEYQENRGGKRYAKENQKDVKTPIYIRSKNKEERIKKEEVRTKNITSAVADVKSDESQLETFNEQKTLGSKIFDAYSDAYRNKYGVTPIRNLKSNSLCKQLGQRLGEDAIGVVEFYLDHRDGWFLKNQHDLGSLLRNAEGMHTQWKRNKQVTSVDVRNFEKVSETDELLSKISRGEV